ncbi:MAG: 30S ribosomal protein S5 [Candidatus Pacearchaeota archaeon]
MTEEEQKKQAEEQEAAQAQENSQQQESSEEDEFAENPEEVLSEEELQEIKKMEEENRLAQESSKEENKEEKGPIESWEPKTELGKEVKDGKIKNIDQILDADRKIMEPEIVDSLVSLKTELIAIGQSKGKFGGGKRRAWKQTQKKVEEGSILKFSAMAVVGDEQGHIGLGEGSATETLPARDKAIRKAKLNLFKVKRGCAAFDCDCPEQHTVPFKVSGKCGSVKISLMSAPQGTRLTIADELKKIVSLAGISDIYSRTFGKTETTINLARACVDALKKTTLNANEKEQ